MGACLSSLARLRVGERSAFPFVRLILSNLLFIVFYSFYNILFLNILRISFNKSFCKESEIYNRFVIK